LEVMRQMPGQTVKDLAVLTDSTPDRIKAALRRMSFIGYVRYENGPSDGKTGRNPQIWFANENKQPTKEPRAKRTTPPKVIKPLEIPVAPRSTVEALVKEVEALRLWKSRAILRFPELDVDPIILLAREALAKHYPDQKQRDDILSGKADERPPMLAMVEIMDK